MARYLDELDRADRKPGQVPEARIAHLRRKIVTVREHMQQLATLGDTMRQAPDQQLSVTDPDARSMATQGRGPGIVGYTVQMAVEPAHHLIVTHEVINEGHDRHALASTAEAARHAMGEEHLTAIADRGYYKGEEILACEQRGITPLVPRSQTSTSAAAGRFDKRDFRYDAERDNYVCPAKNEATRRMTTVEDNATVHIYWSSACPACLLRTGMSPKERLYRQVVPAMPFFRPVLRRTYPKECVATIAFRFSKSKTACR